MREELGLRTRAEPHGGAEPGLSEGPTQAPEHSAAGPVQSVAGSH